MMTSSSGNFFRVTGPLWGEFTGDRWILLTQACDADRRCFFFISPWTNGSANTRDSGYFEALSPSRWRNCNMLSVNRYPRYTNRIFVIHIAILMLWAKLLCPGKIPCSCDNCSCDINYNFNSLASEGCEWNFKFKKWFVIFQLKLVIDGRDISFEFAFIWMSIDH